MKHAVYVSEVYVQRYLYRSRVHMKYFKIYNLHVIK